MKSSQSKFSNEKSKSNTSAKPSSSSGSSKSGCCCGSKFSDEIDEMDIIESEEK